MKVTRYLKALRAPDDIARELYWRVTGREGAPLPPSWPVPDGITVHWPKAYNWKPASRWMCHFPMGFSRFAKVNVCDIPQDDAPEGVIFTRFSYHGQEYPVIIDYSDYMDRITPHEGVAAYFKMQFRRTGYGDPRIIPGGYPVGSPYSYRFLSRLRAVNQKHYDVYGRFGMRFSAEVRQKAITLLSELPGFVGGTQFVRNSRFLLDMARTRVGIDMPGNGDFCFRLVDYLSIGVCTICPRHRTELPVPLTDGENIVFCKDDLSDLVALCRQYLNDSEARDRIARGAREYFDRYLHRDQLAAYYLHSFHKIACGG